MSATKVARSAEERGQGICRTCLAPIWNEGGTVGHQRRADGWSDRVEQGGDSLVCFKAVEYRHVPLKGREAAIWDEAAARALEDAAKRLGENQMVREGDVKEWLTARAAEIPEGKS